MTLTKTDILLKSNNIKKTLITFDWAEQTMFMLDLCGGNVHGLTSVVDMLVEGDVCQSDVRVFVEDFGADSLDYLESYMLACEEFSMHVIQAFLEIWSVQDIDHIEDAFDGHYDSKEDFINNYYECCESNMPHWLVVDYDQTWEYSFRYDYDFDEDNSIVWRTSW